MRQRFRLRPDTCAALGVRAERALRRLGINKRSEGGRSQGTLQLACRMLLKYSSIIAIFPRVACGGVGEIIHELHSEVLSEV